jgi:curved DNA-binding protein CbpA
MPASHSDGDITYYEELGLTPGASAEQIRDAFRLNVRLLHPDQQTDPQLKDIAERQMRKLNRIYAVLSDPQARRLYDENPDTDFPAPIVFALPTPPLQQLKAKLLWAAAIIVSATLLIWLAADSQPGVQGHFAEASSPPPSSAQVQPSDVSSGENDLSYAAQIRQLRSDLRAVVIERDAAIRELNKFRSPHPAANPPNFSPLDTAESRPASNVTDPQPTPRLSVLANVAPLARVERPLAPNRQLAGFWFYARPPLGQMNRNQALYPPEFIEATLLEEGGTLRGTFRGRYQIADRAISPDVNFTFTGTQNGSQMVCPWFGPGGAKGDITLKLTSENTLRIDWNASELGSQLGLNSGTAILTRRIE